MSKVRVIKARFFRYAIQVGELTGSFTVSATNETVKRAMLETYRSLHLDEVEPIPPGGGDMPDRYLDLTVQLEEMFDSPDRP